MMRKFYLLLLILLLLFVSTGCEKPVPTQPLPEISGSLPKWGLNANLAMFSLVREALSLYPDMRRILEVPDDPDLPDICDRPVVVTILRENNPPVWGVGSQGCIRESLLRAVYQLTQDENFQRFYMLDLSKITVRIDILYSRKQLDLTDLSKVRVEPGIHGLILQNGDQLTFQPPYAFLYYSWEEEKRGRGIRTRRLEKQLDYLSEAAEVGEGNWRDYPIYRFLTISFLQHRPDFVPLRVFRDASLIKNFRSSQIGRAAIDAGRYLDKTFNYHSQRFRYRFNPVTLEKSSYTTYNSVLHAGTVYGMVSLYKASQKEEFFNVTHSSMDYLIKRISPPLLEPELLCVKRSYVAQLGTSALTLIALSELPEKLLSNIGIPRINRLARFISEMQESDGRFYNFYWQRLIGYMPQKQSAYFAGESLLALVRYYKINPNVEWLHAARSAADFQIKEFERTGKPNTWTIQGLAELHEIDPQHRYAEACFAMADYLLRHQWGNPLKKRRVIYPDYRGGFDNTTPPRTADTARRLEALLAAHRLAFQMDKDTSFYEKSILAATYFILQNQYRRDNIYWIKLPDQVRGAFRNGLIDPEIRMDTCQHAIVALTGAYDVAYMRETGKVPTEFRAEGTQALVDDLQSPELTAGDEMEEPTEE